MLSITAGAIIATDGTFVFATDARPTIMDVVAWVDACMGTTSQIGNGSIALRAGVIATNGTAGAMLTDVRTIGSQFSAVLYSIGNFSTQVVANVMKTS